MFNILKFLFVYIWYPQKDIQSDKSDLCQASLQALGHCLYQQQIARLVHYKDSFLSTAILDNIIFLVWLSSVLSANIMCGKLITMMVTFADGFSCL